MKENKSYNALNLAIAYFIDPLFQVVFGKKTLRIPKEIGNYKFSKKMPFDKGGDIAVALYKNDKNEKAVAKIWNGNFKNYSYFSLKNEYFVYKTLNELISRLKNIPSKYQNVHIPKLIDYIESEKKSILMIEYVDGTIASTLSDKGLIETYLTVTKFLSFLSKKMSASESKNLSSRNGLYYVISYPLILIRALMLNPNSLALLLKGSVIFAKNIWNYIRDNELSIVHRDLNFDNIIISKKGIYLIDFQLCVLTFRVVEYSTTLRYCWDKNRVKMLLFEKISEDDNKNKEILKSIQPAIIFTATHGLIDNNYENKVVESFKQYLKFGILSNKKSVK